RRGPDIKRCQRRGNLRHRRAATVRVWVSINRDDGEGPERRQVSYSGRQADLRPDARDQERRRRRVHQEDQYASRPQLMNNTPLLELEGISKRFPGVVALDQVNLTVGEGDVVALIGENGAGKSTLMNIVGGAIARDGGTIKINGEPVQINSP